MPKKLLTYIAILIVLDVAYIIYLFFCPVHYQDALTIFFFSIWCAIINLVAALILLLFKKKKWSLALSMNAIILPLLVWSGASLSTKHAWQQENIDFKVSVNDSVFYFDILRNDSLFYVYYEGAGYSEGYGGGTYVKKGESDYSMTIDTLNYQNYKDKQHIHFRFANDSLYGFHGRNLRVK